MERISDTKRQSEISGGGITWINNNCAVLPVQSHLLVFAWHSRKLRQTQFGETSNQDQGLEAVAHSVTKIEGFDVGRSWPALQPVMK